MSIPELHNLSNSHLNAPMAKKPKIYKTNSTYLVITNPPRIQPGNIHIPSNNDFFLANVTGLWFRCMSPDLNGPMPVEKVFEIGTVRMWSTTSFCLLAVSEAVSPHRGMKSSSS